MQEEIPSVWSWQLASKIYLRRTWMITEWADKNYKANLQETEDITKRLNFCQANLYSKIKCQ